VAERSHPFQINQTRLPKAKQLMTIAAGFLCSDGFVLAADTLYSGTNKRYAAKIWTLQRGDVAIAVAGAGVAVLLARLKDDIYDRLTSSMSRRDVVELIDGILYSIFHKHKPAPNEFPIQVLVGIRTHGDCSLYENDSFAMLARVRKNRTCIGWGSSLGLYFADTLFRKQMPMKWAEIISAHLVRQVKRYADGCGGRTHMVSVPALGQIKRFQPKEIRDLERYFAEIDTAMQLVLPGSGGARMNESTRRQRLQMLNDAIDRVRNTVVIEGTFDVTLEPLTLHATGTVDVSENPEAVEPVLPKSKRGQKGRPPSRG
jgi:20S proteasome alpha/beta subunit